MEIESIHRNLITLENICFPFIITRFQKLLAEEIDYGKGGIGHIGIEGAENWLYYSRSQKASVAFTIIVGWMDSVVFPFGNEK